MNRGRFGEQHSTGRIIRRENQQFVFSEKGVENDSNIVPQNYAQYRFLCILHFTDSLEETSKSEQRDTRVLSVF